MQAIAAEFGYSETTFVLPPADPAHAAQVRIFTPKNEIAFAGHPNVGTAVVLARQGELFGRPVGTQLLFEEAAGLVAVTVEREGDTAIGAMLTTPQGLSRGATVAVETIAACTGLAPAAIRSEAHPPVVASAGLAFAFAELQRRDDLTAAAADVAAIAEHVPLELANGIVLYVRGGEDDADLHVRAFVPLHGVVEDPATGSANAALAGLLADLADAADATFSLAISQGHEIGRPSRLDTVVEKRAGTVATIRIGGRCVEIMRGTLADEIFA